MTDIEALLKRLDDFANRGYGDSWRLLVFEQATAAIRGLQAEQGTDAVVILQLQTDILRLHEQLKSEYLRGFEDAKEAATVCALQFETPYINCERAGQDPETGANECSSLRTCICDTQAEYAEAIKIKISQIKPKEGM